MALVSCGECGHKVSDRAEACPRCGCPLTTPQRPAAPPAAPSSEGWEVVAKTTFSKKGLLLQMGGLLTLWFLGAIFGLLGVLLALLVMTLTYLREPLLQRAWFCGACGKELLALEERCPHCRQPVIKASWF